MGRFDNVRTFPGQPAEPDPWGLDDPAYDTHTFYTAAGADSESVRVRVNNKYLSIVGNLVASREIPDYKTTADFVRDAIYHRLYYYQHAYQKPEIGRLIRTDMELERSKERIAQAAVFDEAIRTFKEEFQFSLTARNRAGAEEALGRVQRCLDSEDAEDSRYRDELNRLEAYMKMELGTWR